MINNKLYNDIIFFLIWLNLPRLMGQVEPGRKNAKLKIYLKNKHS